MTGMGPGVIRPEGAQPAPSVDPNFVPLLGGLKISGVTGVGPSGYRSGSRFAVRSPILVVTEPISLVATMDWSDARFLGDKANAVLQAQLALYTDTDAFRGIFRLKNQLVITDDPSAQSGGGTITGRVKVAPGSYYVAGSFVGRGGAASDDYVVGLADSIFLEVRPVERDDVLPRFSTVRTLHKLSVFDQSTGAEDATTVWGETDSVTTVRQNGTTVFIHSHPDTAAVAVHASNEVESAGVRKTASNEQTYQHHSGANLKYGEIGATITYGTPGVTY